ncbi:MAG TPA: AAA family ATPase [Chthoniobacteraceae bacterium]|nr:AAA family ATPase [Chthoniobacteraceae bacterium]
MNPNIIEVPDPGESGVSSLPRLAEKIFAEHESFRVVKDPEPPPAGANFIRFYGLSENPFSDAVNPGYFYKTGGHADALAKMMLAVEHNTSLGMITGPSGTGKTLITQLLLQQLDAAKFHAVLVLVTPGMSKTALLREILSELGIAMPEGISRTHDLLRILSHYIIELHENGRRLVLIIDECHFLSADCLHVIRTISNIEIPECKLVTSLLFGEERFTERLKHASYESLRNRMYLRGELGAMDAEECAQYIKFRLMVAGRMTDLFDESALAALHARSGGVCRKLSKLCMLTLLMGAMKGRELLQESDVAACASMM